MKILVAIASILFASLLSGTVLAKDQHYKSHKQHGGYSKQYRNNHKMRHNQPRHYYKKHRGYGGHKKNSHAHKDNYLIGGLIAGALLHNAYSQYQRPQEVRSTVVHRTVIRSSPRVIYRSSPSFESSYEGSYQNDNHPRFVRDVEGRCFELRYQSGSVEHLQEVNAGQCGD